METSDSECFESADEEFYSDEDTKPKSRNPTSELPPKEVQHPKTDVKNPKPTSNSNGSGVDNQKVDDTKAPATKKHEKKEKPKLATKLGMKVKKSDLNVHPKDRNTETDNGKSDCKNETKSEFTDTPSKDERHVEHTVISDKSTNSPNIPKYENDQKITDEKEDNMWENDYDWEPVPANQLKNNPVVEKDEKTDKEKEVNMWEDDEDWEPKSDHQHGSNLQTEPNMWEDDDSWEPLTETADSKAHLTQTQTNNASNNSGWSGWGNWDVSSLLSTATMGVTTITNHVSQGITTVLESGIGVPDPEELAKLHIEEKQTRTEKPNEVEPKNPNTSSNVSFGLGNFVSSVTQITKLVETTGNKVLSGGLDTLETIGKKTMEVLQEGDPGLKKKRAFLKIDSDKPVLSQLLREAKEKAEQENRELEEKHFQKKANYETLFDDHQGLIHLEALEMLSKQCDIKLQTLLASQSGAELIEMQETLEQVKELCELNEDEEEESALDMAEVKEKLETAVSEMNISISYDKLISTWAEAEEWLKNLNLNVCSELELHEQAIDTLAQLTAIAVEQFHKAGELLLIKDHRSTVDETDSLVQLTTTLTALIGSIATILSNKLIEKSSMSNNKDNINSLITNVYFEAANSGTYIKDAFHLLIPVLQVGAV